eukprot:PhF_6_TR35756/c0_g1_i1/m.51942
MFSPHCFLLSVVLAMVFHAHTITANVKNAGPLEDLDFIKKAGKIKEAGLPNIQNPAVYKQLQCSACRSVTRELHTILNKQFSNRKIGEIAIAEITDGFCERLADEFGMYQPNRPHLDLPDEEKRPDKGYWVNAFFIARCSETLDKFEDYLFREYKKHETEYMMTACPDCFEVERKMQEQAKKEMEREKAEEERLRKKKEQMKIEKNVEM